MEANIVGIGISSCIGNSLDKIWLNLSEYSKQDKLVGAYKFDENRKQLGYTVPVVGKPYTEDKTEENFVTTCVYKCLIDFDVNYKKILSKKSIGIIVATDSCVENNIQCLKDYQRHNKSKSIKLHSSFDTLNSRLSILNYGLNPCFNITVNAACASGGHSIGLAMMYMGKFNVDYVLIIAYQEMNDYAQLSFDATGLFSKKHIARPFDSNRDGLIPSSGCACMLLSREVLTKYYGKIINYGFSTGNDKIIPDKKAIKKCLGTHLQYMSLYSNVYINAHAVGSVLGDKVELQAINEIFDSTENNYFVTSTKAVTGHECWMSGISEIIYSLVQVKYLRIIRQLNFEKTEIELSSNILIPTENVKIKPEYIISNNFGFGGSNSSILIQTNNSQL